MKKDDLILINVNNQYARVALLESSKVVEYYIEQNDTQRLVGNIYLGIVKNILPAIQAAFIDIGIEMNAFLHINEVIPDSEFYSIFTNNIKQEELNRYNKDITLLLTIGQEVLVQVIKEPYKNKGPQLTMKCTFPGKYLVYLPQIEHIGISHRIENSAEIAKLLNIVKQSKKSKGGFIIRTQAEGVSENEIVKEMEQLVKNWETLIKKNINRRAPYLIYKDSNLITRVIRDMYNENVNKIIIDSEQEYNYIKNYIKTNYPDMQIFLELYNGDMPLFEKYKIEKDIEKALRRKIWLKNGSYLIIDETEALSTIDINSGKYIEKVSLEETVFNTNLFAIKEIVRQIRLRNLCGIIVIDFIDMQNEEHKAIVLKEFNEELKKDRVKTIVSGYTSFGLIELTRKRQGKSLRELLFEECPHCQGNGKIKSFKWVLFDIEKILDENVKYFGRKNFSIFVSPTFNKYLSETEFVANLEKKNLKNSIQFFVDEKLKDDEFIIKYELK
ncbi:MAG TPA: Rne/Rng family ribonuclease [bacterium]|nr:Rne/Rng family ribonuclease [bacterium]HOL47252.1 Rne/Rng family ribonuclease [bacterium]HPQ19288.1 Rne/Rng family ribonuclease [bacterium]